MKRAREGCKGNDNGNVRVAGDKEGEGSKVMVMAMAIGMAGKWRAMTMRVAGKQW